MVVLVQRTVDGGGSLSMNDASNFGKTLESEVIFVQKSSDLC